MQQGWSVGFRDTAFGWGLFFLGLWGCVSPSSVAAEIRAKRVVVFPTQVHLGEPFVLRVDAALPAGVRTPLSEDTSLGQTRLLRSPQIRSLDTHPGLSQIRLDLAIFFSRNFGPQVLRLTEIPLQMADGSEEILRFEPQTVVLQRKYRDDQAYPLPREETFAWLKVPEGKDKEPVHEWKALPDLRPQAESKSLWIAILVGAVLVLGSLIGFLIVRSQKKRRRPPKPLTPLEEALQRLQALRLPPASDRMAIAAFSSACAGVLRAFLQHRLRLDVIGLTSREIQAALSPFETAVPWRSPLLECFEHTDGCTFSPWPVEPPTLAALPSEIQKLLSQIERWKAAEEEKIALQSESTSARRSRR